MMQYDGMRLFGVTMLRRMMTRRFRKPDMEVDLAADGHRWGGQATDLTAWGSDNYDLDEGRWFYSYQF